MTYLFLELSIWLILAFLLGLLMGFSSDARGGEKS